jgi:carbon starvation protein
MLLEGLVAIMALIAASILEPGIFFAINSSAAAVGEGALQATATISSWGFPVSAETMQNLADKMGEKTLFARTGGAPSLAVGMANIFASAFGEKLTAIWYHFAIMFEAIFILTTLDAGTRVARFMMQDLLDASGNIRKKIPNSFAIFCSFAVVAAWGYLLYLGVVDPKGGVNILWPLFGMSNQMLAGIALILATVIILKSDKKKYFFVTAIPLIFVVVVTTSAAIEKIFSSDVKVGFFALANMLSIQLASGSVADVDMVKRLIFNQKLVGFLALSFLAILWIVLIAAVKKCLKKS